MKVLGESVAADCRYGDEAVAVFSYGAALIWERSLSDYQGYAEILVRTTDGRFAHYEWDYGSCSGCDSWEAAHLSGAQIQETMRNDAAWFQDQKALMKYLNRHQHGNPDRQDDGDRLTMREAFERWLATTS